MERCFITGFGPFGNVANNPSSDLAQALNLPNTILDVSYRAVDNWLESYDLNPYDVILHLGYADRLYITLEKCAKNIAGQTRDQRGFSRTGVIERNEPVNRFSNLWDGIDWATLDQANSVKLGDDAGSFLCNYIFYRSLQKFPDKKVGFIHVPAFNTIGFEAQRAILTGILNQL